MTTNHLTPVEIGELEFLRFLNLSITGFCGETHNFRARKAAADLGAKVLPRLQELEEKLAHAEAGEPELPLNHAA